MTAPNNEPKKRKAGILQGKITLPDNFDELFEEDNIRIQKMFEEEEEEDEEKSWSTGK